MFVPRKIRGMRTGILTFLLAFTMLDAISQTTLTLQPNAAQGKDAMLNGLPINQNGNYGSNVRFFTSAWTSGGVPLVTRSVIDFDLTQLPQNAQIISAYMSLYHDPNSSFPHSTTSGTNASYLQRITSAWNENTVTWNTQPSTTTANQVTLPASTSTTQHYLNIDVTTLVQDMVNNPSSSFGFMLRLQNESYYRRLDFASSDHINSSLHPKLVVTYTNNCSLAAIATVDSNATCYGLSDGGVTASVTGGTGPYQYQWSNGSTTSVSIPTPSCLEANFPLNGNAVDVSTNNTSATLNGVIPAGGSNGNISGALRFDGLNDYIELNNSNPIITGGPFTISIQAKMLGQGGGVLGQAPLYVQRGNPVGAGNSYIFCSAQNSNNNISFSIRDNINASGSKVFYPTPNDTNWHCYGFVLDANDSMHIYLDGIKVSSGKSTQLSSNLGINVDYVSLGRHQYTNPGMNLAGWFDGDMDDFKIYSCGLNPAEMSSLCNATSVSSIVGLSAGTYSVTVTDANGCTDSSSITITEPTALVSTALVDSNVSCNGLSDGGATVGVTGGTQSYSYQWNNSSTIAGISGVAAGTYSVTITDANGCTDSNNITITEPAVLNVTSTVNHMSCPGGIPDGAVTVSATGGVLPYSYLWNNGQVAAANLSLLAGTYTVTVTDNNGCTNTSSAIVTEPTPLAISTNTIPPTCYGAQTGSAYVISKSGGTPPYSVLWFTSVQGDSIDNMPAGTYPITLTDNNGCYITESVIIDDKDSISLALTKTDVICQGGNNGSLSASASGSNWGFSYSWNNGSTSPTINGLSSGSYTVTVTDQLGCTISSVGIINYTNSLPNVDLGPDTGYGPGLVTLTTGATGIHQWSTGVTTTDLTFQLSSDTTIWVLVADSNDCSNTDTINISLYLSAEDEVAEVAAVLMYPNPTSDLLNVKISSLQASEVVLQVVSNNGQLIETRRWDNIGSELQTEISLGDYSKGVYFINLMIDGKRHTETITVY